MKHFHVTYRKDAGKWFLLEESSSFIEMSFVTKAQAVATARLTAMTEKASLRIHKRNGQIQEERTYGDDPESKG